MPLGKPLTPQERDDLLESLLNCGYALNSIYTAIEQNTLPNLEAERLLRLLAEGITTLADGFRKRLLSGGVVLDRALTIEKPKGNTWTNRGKRS